MGWMERDYAHCILLEGINCPVADKCYRNWLTKTAEGTHTCMSVPPHIIHENGCEYFLPIEEFR